MAEDHAAADLVVTPDSAFRVEVRDKLFVVFNGCHNTPLARLIHRKQCEDFLVEVHESQLAARDQALVALVVQWRAEVAAGDKSISGGPYEAGEECALERCADQLEALLAGPDDARGDSR